MGTEKTDIKGRTPWPGFESSTPVTQVESVAVVAKLYVMVIGASKLKRVKRTNLCIY
jgi:hypothetical protein